MENIDNYILDEETLAEHYKESGNTYKYEAKSKLVEYLKELKAYKEDEEQGVLIKLPCKVGDTVYIIVEKSRVYEMEVMSVCPFGAFYEDEEKAISRIYNLFLDGNVYYKHCTFYDIGKTVFLTKEEAEQALAEKKGE